MGQRWRILMALTFARASMGYQFQSVASVAPFVTADLGLDKTQLGWLIGLYLLPGVVFALPGGFLGARYGDKRLTLFGLGLMAGGGLWLALAGSFAEANVARLVSGAGAVIINVLFTKMVADWFDGKDRLLAMSFLVNAWPIGIGLALLVIGTLGEAANWHWALGSVAAFAVCGFAAVLGMYRPPDGMTPTAAAAPGLRMLDADEWRLLVIGSMPWLLFNAAYQILVSFLPSFFLETGLGISRAGATAALNTVLIVISVQVGGFILKRSARPDIVCGAAIVAWCAALVLLTQSSVPLIWIVLGGLVAGLPAGAFVSLPAEFLRAETRGVGMGVFYTIYYLGCALVPSLAGALYDLSGSARVTLWMAAVLALACIPALLLFRVAMRRRKVP